MLFSTKLERAEVRRAWAKHEGGQVLHVSPTCPRMWMDPHLHGKFRKAYDFCRSPGLPRQTEDVSTASHPCRDDVVSGPSRSPSSPPTFLQPYSIHPQTLPLLSFTFYSRNSFKVGNCVSALSLEIKPEGILFEDVVPRVSEGFFLRDSGTGRLYLILSMWYPLEISRQPFEAPCMIAVYAIEGSRVLGLVTVLGSEMHLNEILLPKPR